MTKFSILFLSSPLGFCVALQYCKLISRFKMLFPFHSRGQRTVQTSTGNVRCTEKSTPPHRCTARGQPVDSMSLKEWIIKAILTLLLQHCQQHENSLLISYFITCFSVLFFFSFFLEIQLTERRSSAAPRTSIIHFFTADSWEFLWILKTWEQPTDQMCYIALIWQTSLGLNRFLLHSPTRHFCQAAVNSESLVGSYWLVTQPERQLDLKINMSVVICVIQSEEKAFWV